MFILWHSVPKEQGLCSQSWQYNRETLGAQGRSSGWGGAREVGVSIWAGSGTELTWPLRSLRRPQRDLPAARLCIGARRGETLPAEPRVYSGGKTRSTSNPLLPFVLRGSRRLEYWCWTWRPRNRRRSSGLPSEALLDQDLMTRLSKSKIRVGACPPSIPCVAYPFCPPWISFL